MCNLLVIRIENLRQETENARLKLIKMLEAKYASCHAEEIAESASNFIMLAAQLTELEEFQEILEERGIFE